jgi:hypothetical protein
VIEDRQALEVIADQVEHQGDVDGVIPAHLCAPPGLLGDVVEWINATSRNVVPQHALGAALSLPGRAHGAPLGRADAAPDELLLPERRRLRFR